MENPVSALPASSLASCNAVLELPALYGSFSFPEKLLQRIWLRREFVDRNTATTDGRNLTILESGRWNFLGGPDFKGARIRWGDGCEVCGDVELHLHASDWTAHRHASDPAYDKVILHVVLFPPADDQPTIGVGGLLIPTLVLLPLLLHDLEEYAADDAVARLANRPAAQIIELLGPLDLQDLLALLSHHAEQRWLEKVRYATLRIQRLGWIEACHHTALEILGYRFNRAPMLRVAASCALSSWTDGSVDPEKVFVAESTWSLQGVRPANYPRRRLIQYKAWACASPDWPTRLGSLGDVLVRSGDSWKSAEIRRIHGFAKLRREWSTCLTGGVVTGSKFDNLMCDGFLPLLAAKGSSGLKPMWFHWFVGDVPPLWREALRHLQIFSTRSRPACHGAVQGLLGWLINRERSALPSAGPSA
jgi:hypothetical protein